jgi:hypothetical protein
VEAFAHVKHVRFGTLKGASEKTLEALRALGGIVYIDGETDFYARRWREKSGGKPRRGRLKQMERRFRLAVNLLGRDLERTQMDKATLAFLGDHVASTSLCDLLREHAYRKDLDFQGIVFRRVNSLEAENARGVYRSCIDAGLLLVGWGLSGDPVAVDLETGIVGFVDQDAYAHAGEDRRDKKAVRDAFVPTPLDLGTFVLGAVLCARASESGLAMPFPIDPYGAHALLLEHWDAIRRKVREFEASI